MKVGASAEEARTLSHGTGDLIERCLRTVVSHDGRHTSTVSQCARWVSSIPPSDHSATFVMCDDDRVHQVEVFRLAILTRRGHCWCRKDSEARIVLDSIKFSITLKS